MSAVLNLHGAAVRSVVEERAVRPPVIGRIRPGIKVLTSAARENHQAVALYNELLAAGESFDTIAKVLETRCKLKNALTPRNVRYFTCRRSDFTNPDVADEILRLYGEDKGEGVRLYRFPVLFAFNDWMQNLPNEMAAWGTTGRKFFSEYGTDGTRYCKTYAKVEVNPRARRAARHFGGRTVIFRQDESIPDGVCDPEQCPQYQARQCNLSASFIFAIPEIKGLGLIELPTNSIYVLQKAYAAMQTVQLARGRLTGTRFWISKREFEITRINEAGEAVRVKQPLTVLDADIDIGALLDGAEDPMPSLESANAAIALVEAGGTVQPLRQDEASGQAEVASESDGDGSQPVVPTAGNAEQGAESDSAQPGSLLELVTRGADVGQGSVQGSEETLEEKLHRMSDLLQRLGLSAPERQQHFRVYAHRKFGRGWIDRIRDVDAMNARLAEGLQNQAALDDEIKEAANAALFDEFK
jgi:hypothetical protein